MLGPPRGSKSSATEPTSDDKLLERLRAGDDEAYAELIRLFGGRLLVVCRRFMPSEDEARDAFQDAMLRAFTRIEAFEGRSSLYTWLYRIVVNSCLMRLRSQKRRPEASLDELMPTFDDRGCRLMERHRRPRVTAVQMLERDDVRRQVQNAIRELPSDFRTVLVLRDLEERTTKETAGILDISEGLVKVRLHRARAALKKLLEPVIDAEMMEVEESA